MSAIFDTRPFPGDLVTVVMKTILDGELPVLQFLHTADNRWALGDGLHDPNQPDACEVAHIWHVLDQDPSIQQLSALPIGYQADREAVGMPWVVTKFEWSEE